MRVKEEGRRRKKEEGRNESEERNESRRKKEGDEWVGRNKSKGKRKK